MRGTLWMMGRLLFAVVSMNAMAAESERDSDTSTHRWLFSVGAQVDNQHGSVADASIGFTPNKYNNLSFDVNHSSLSSDVSDVKTNGATLTYTFDGDNAGVTVGGHWFEDVDILSAKEATASLLLHGEIWHFNVDGEYRKSDFDPFQANTIVRRRDGTLVPISAMATCNMNNSGFGAEAGFDGASWRGYVRDMQFRYSDNDCTFNSPGLNALSKTNVQEFRQLAAILTNRLSRSAVALVRKNNDNSFLAAELDAGVKVTANTTILSFDYQHARDQFGDLSSNTYSTSADFEVLKSSDVAVLIGVTNAESIGATVFAGVTFTTRF
jgi:hypothetical protein